VVVPEALLEKAAGFKSTDSFMLRLGGAFIAVDGYLDSKTAALLEPYSDEPSNRGKLLCGEEALAVSVRQVLAVGVQPVIHAMGDKAIDTALKVIEQAPKNKVRFRMEQAAVLNNDLIQRLKNLGVVVTVQPKVIATEFKVWSANLHLGSRAKLLHPLKTLLNKGIKIAGGSDCPMEPLSPLVDIQDVVLRESYVEQRMSVEEALRMYTFDAAYTSGEEDIKGSIEEGKLADLTVLSDNPLGVEPNRIRDIAVAMTIVDGKVVYSNTD
jgi:predicted amidohydrolase YtcJ